MGAASISVAKSALTIAVRHATRRRQFGDEPTGLETLILDYPTHQRRLMPRLAATFAYHFAFERLIDDYMAGDLDPRVLEAQAAGLKAYGTWHAIDTVQACREACGGVGYLAENRFGALRADADVFTTYSEAAGNSLMFAMTEHALQQAKGMSPMTFQLALPC